jgi:hypothetical protein
MKKPNLIPKRLRVHVQMNLSPDCHHSSALNPPPARKLNSCNAQAILLSSKWLQCGTSRYVSPWCIYNRYSVMISVQTLVVARGPKFMKAFRAHLQQSQSHAKAQASSSHTQPVDASTSVTPPAPGTAAAQPPPIRWWAHIVLFLCCVSPPHANGR